MKENQRDQLLAYLAVKLAKIDAATTSLGPFLVVALAELEPDEARREELRNRLLRMLAINQFSQMSIISGNLAHMKEQFPEIAPILDEIMLLNETDINEKLQKMAKAILEQDGGAEDSPSPT